MKYTNILGEDCELYFVKSLYADNDTLAIQIMDKMEDGDEPFCSLTVNLPESEKGDRQYIDINNCPKEIIDKLLDEKCFTYTGTTTKSGFVTYPEVKFNDEWIKAIDEDKAMEENKSDELKNFYFDFGSWEGYPYGRGEYVKVEAHNLREAQDIYRYKHPDESLYNHYLNCADYYDEKQWAECISHFEYGHYKCVEEISVNDIKKVDLENSKKIYDDNIFKIDISKCDDEMKDFLLELRDSIYGFSKDKESPDFKENPDNFAVHNSAEAVLQAIDDSDISSKFYDAYDESIGIKPQSI